MKTIYFSLLFALFLTLIKADGDAYQATYYGGSKDGDTELYPSCLDRKTPDTSLYAAVSTTYKKDLCNSYAVVMSLKPDNSDDYRGKMIKVRIIDSCHECERSHIDLSEKAFKAVNRLNDGVFPVIWVAAKDGHVTRDIVYPSSYAEQFAKKYDMSKSSFVSQFKKQALNLINSSSSEARFKKVTETPKTTIKKTTAVAQKTAARPVTTKAPVGSAAKPAKAPIASTPPVNGIGNISVTTGKTTDKTVPKNAPVVGKTKKVDPNKIDKNQTNYTEEELKAIEAKNEKELKEDQQKLAKEGKKGKGPYLPGLLSASLTVSGAAGIALLYLKKQSPGKYEELKSKFPEAFDNIKRSVSRSATSIRRGVSRTATSIRGRAGRTNRHTEHPPINYREMPPHMYGSDGIPRFELHDEPMSSFPETSIKV